MLSPIIRTGSHNGTKRGSWEKAEPGRLKSAGECERRCSIAHVTAYPESNQWHEGLLVRAEMAFSRMLQQWSSGNVMDASDLSHVLLFFTRTDIESLAERMRRNPHSRVMYGGVVGKRERERERERERVSVRCSV